MPGYIIAYVTANQNYNARVGIKKKMAKLLDCEK